MNLHPASAQLGSQSADISFCWCEVLGLSVGEITTRRKPGLIAASSHHCGTLGTSSPSI